MTLKLAAALIYWVIVALWLVVLGTIVINYLRNPRMFGTTRMLLMVVGIDTTRNIVENVYFGAFFGSQYGIFPGEVATVLGRPEMLLMPKILNIAAGCLVLGLLLMHWLPRSVRERGKAEQVAADLNTLACVDGLTKLTNRRHFRELAKAEWARFQRYGRPLSMLMIDVDHFKSVNDKFGHAAGDRVLKAVATACLATKRETDVAGRIGGEEFALLLPETDEAAAAQFAERLRKQIKDVPATWEGQQVPVTVSIGVAGATLSMADFQVLLQRADEALYKAKEAGRNRVVRAPQELHASYQMAAE